MCRGEGWILLRSIRSWLAPSLFFSVPRSTCFLSPPTTLSDYVRNTHSDSHRFSISPFVSPTSHPLVFPHFSEVCCFPASPSFALFFLSVSLSRSLSPSLLLSCLSTGGKCPADALAVIQGVADFITMAALYHHGSALWLPWPASCYLVVVQLACVYT